MCLAVIEVIGFLFKSEKVVKSTATMDNLEEQIKVVGQIVNLKISSSAMQSWDWNKQYVALDIDSHDQKLTCCQYVLEIAFSLICPLAPSVVQRPLPGSTLDISDILHGEYHQHSFNLFSGSCGTHSNLKVKKYWEM